MWFVLVFICAAVLIRTYVEYCRVVDYRNAAVDFFDVIKIAVAVFHVIAENVVTIDIVFAPFETVHDIHIFVVQWVVKGTCKVKAFAFAKVELIG